MLEIAIQENAIQFGDALSLTFQRTLRIPDDGKTYPLPPGLGRFPICKVEDYRDRVPAGWAERGGAFIPMYQREAMWIRFRYRHWKPNAVKVAVGKVNAVSGKPWSRTLRAGENDYVVCPPQPWLDGIKAGEGTIRQFVAMPLGLGYTVEAQVTGKEEFGGMQIIVYEPKPGLFPDEGPPMGEMRKEMMLGMGSGMTRGGAEMGLAAGGKMRQKIYPDPHGIDTWDQENYGEVYVHIVNSVMYRQITGTKPPPTPVSAKTYTRHGLPWFDLYDREMGDIAPSQVLQEVKSVKELDAEKELPPQQDDETVEVPGDQVVKYQVDPTPAEDDPS